MYKISKYVNFFSLLRYYGCLPTAKETILTSLMQHLMILTAFGILHITIGHVIMLTLPGTLQNWLDNYPSLVCSLYAAHGYAVVVPCLTFILAFKIYLHLKPLMYLEMNHEQLSKITIVFHLLISFLQFYFVSKQSGNLCARQKANEIRMIYKFDLSFKKLNFIYPISAYNGILMGIFEIWYGALKVKQWRRQKKALVYPTPQV